jgi:hypothetical protein
MLDLNRQLSGEGPRAPLAAGEMGGQGSDIRPDAEEQFPA